ncbi:MAG: tol-pal system protein YbgF [Nitrospirota bacterium]|nr:tol-pal system protein YbgF [Nitrospirota bacterium]
MSARTYVLGILLLTTGCAPQAELVKLRGEMGDLRAEMKVVRSQVPDLSGIQKRQDLLEENIKGTLDIQQKMADQGTRHDQLVTDLQILQGRLEENNFRIKELAQKLDDNKFRLAELAARVEQLENRTKSLPTGTADAAEGEKKPEAKQPTPTEAYQQAKSDYDKGNYDLAIAGFENYLKQFPDTSQADSAQYWIGECFYSKKEYDKAITEFTKVLKAYPKSEKAPGARLKIGYSYLNEKHNAKAREHLHRVVKDYPGTPEAEKAKERLKKIGK